MENSLCRICLASDVRLCSIASHLRDMFERISSMTFKREDRRPLVACYICHARLQNCYRLRTSCLQSEQLLTEMMSSGVIVPRSVPSTNTLRVASVLRFSLGHVLQHSTDCHVKEEAPEIIRDAGLEQQNTKDAKMEPLEELHAEIDDDIQCSHVEDPLNAINREPNDVETDDEDIKLDIENTVLEENELNDAGLPSQPANNICPKIVKMVLERMVPNDTIPATDFKKEPQEEHDAQIDNDIQRLHLGDPLDVMKREPDDAEMDDEDLKLEIENTVLEENVLNDAGPPSQTANNIFPKIVKVVLERMVLNETIPATGVPALKKLEENESLLVTECKNVNKSIVVGKLMCDVCSKCFTFKGNLTRHMLTHIDKKLFQCNVCNKCFTHKDYLTQHMYTKHMYTHNGEKLFQCDECNKCFTQKCNLTKHMFTHTENKPFQCDECNKCFKQKYNLTKHMFTHTDNKPFQCDECNKCFTQKCNLTKHMFTHTDNKPFQCNVCNKCFTHKDYLTQHMYTKHKYTHNGEKLFQCDECNKCFTQKCNLTKHMFTHTENKPFQCDECNKCFKQKCNLTQHMFTHTDNKPFQCDECNKSFKQKSNLTQHKFTHIGEKLFQCDECNKRFMWKRNLAQHMFTHTDKKRFQCNVCNKRFTHKCNLTRHIYTH